MDLNAEVVAQTKDLPNLTTTMRISRDLHNGVDPDIALELHRAFVHGALIIWAPKTICIAMAALAQLAAEVEGVAGHNGLRVKNLNAGKHSIAELEIGQSPFLEPKIERFLMHLAATEGRTIVDLGWPTDQLCQHVLAQDFHFLTAMVVLASSQDRERVGYL